MQSNYLVVPQNYQMDIDQPYADSIRKISTSTSAKEKMKEKLPIKLAQQGLKINETKTEENPLKEPTVTIVGETVNCLVAY